MKSFLLLFATILDVQHLGIKTMERLGLTSLQPQSSLSRTL